MPADAINETTTTPTAAMRFRWPWRSYQQRVLDSLDAYVADRRIHIVAAPGSGKTVLGLEIFRRLGLPALVLSPSRTIRDQWLARLDDFLDEPGLPAWASDSIERPAFLTSITYQALHTRSQAIVDDSDDDAYDEEAEPEAPSRSEIDDVTAWLREIGPALIILDEAHHLRNEWWRSLSRVVEEAEDVVLLSLTATPPYDTLGLEWARYEALCGPIDEEISVPELVKCGTLAPHQDYIWPVAPAEDEISAVEKHHGAALRCIAELADSGELLNAVRHHAFIHAREPEDVLDRPEAAVSMLVYLASRGEDLPKDLLNLLALDRRHLPEMSRRWWQVLIHHYLYGSGWRDDASLEWHRETLAGSLRRAGLLWRRELYLDGGRPVTGVLTMSRAKIHACAEVFEMERRARGDSLRQVILTDYVRDGERERLGTWPVFHHLTETFPESAGSMAMLTGSRVILHESLLAELRAATPVAIGDVDRSPEHPGFVRISASAHAGAMVRGITELLASGSLRTVVGTRALLGQGWDAPCINSLVLCTSVGAFVGTNQMRGRAIRRDPADPSKVSSVWHVVALHPKVPEGFADWDSLQARFRHFSGLHHQIPAITSGFERIGLPDPRSNAAINDIRQKSRSHFAEVDQVSEGWTSAIHKGDEQRMVPVTRVNRPPRAPRILFERTLTRFLFTAVLGGVALWAEMVQHFSSTTFARDRPLTILALVSIGAMVFMTPRLVKAFRAWLRTVPIDGTLREISVAVLASLVEAGLITSPREDLTVSHQRSSLGEHVVALHGGTFHEQSLFADSVNEVLHPIQNPRYVIMRPAKWGTRRDDAHAVPTLLGQNKRTAEIFARHWSRHLGPSELLFTRTAEGRRILLRARGRAFSTTFALPSERLDQWQ